MLCSPGFLTPGGDLRSVLCSPQMTGILGEWLYKLVSALRTREREANVVVVDWLPLAHQLYTDAVNNTKTVGHSIARMLDWLQVTGGGREVIGHERHLDLS